jgi:hypothetical protein
MARAKFNIQIISNAGTMIELEEFDKIVSGNFGYLLDLGFTKTQVERVHAMLYVSYLKNDLLVRIGYSIKNDYLDVFIIKNLASQNDYRNSPDTSVSLRHLMRKYQPNFDYKRDYEMLMPKEIGMTQSMETVSQLFGQYAIDILLGKKWESWGEITGYKSPKSPEINIYYEGKWVWHKPKKG